MKDGASSSHKKKKKKKKKKEKKLESCYCAVEYTNYISAVA